MAGRHCFGLGQIASVGLLILMASWQTLESKSLKPALMDRHLRAGSHEENVGANFMEQNDSKLSASSSSAKSHKMQAQSSDKLVPIGAAQVDSKLNKTRPNKRQTEWLDSSIPSQSNSRSRRNEDPWFLDQAPLPLQPYRFNYNVNGNNGLTEQYRQEAGDGKYLTGSYGYVLPDGIYRHVDYVADDRGFRAFIRTSEPGTASESPADVVFNSNPVPQQAGPSYGTGPGTLLRPSLETNSNLAPVWNYSAALSSYVPIDVSRSSDGVSLARRPTGSIINTPLRSFNSLSYAQPPLPTLPNYSFNNFSALSPAQLEPFPPLFESARTSAPSTTNSSIDRLQPTSGWSLSNSWTDRKASNDEESSLKPVGRYTPSGSSELPNRSNQGGLSGKIGDQSRDQPASNSADWLREQFWRKRIEPSKPASSEPNRLDVRPFPPARTSANMLRYDQPFVSYPRENSRRIHYDASYVFHPGSPLLSLERARSIAQLQQFNAASQDSTLLGPDDIWRAAERTSPISNSSSSSLIEQQHHRLQDSRQLVDFAGNVVLTKAHKSAQSTDGDWIRHTQSNLGGDQLLQPPQPHFQSAILRQSSAGQSLGENLGVKGQSKGRLMAPYAGHVVHQQEQQLQEEFAGVKGGQPARRGEKERMQKPADNPEAMRHTSPSPSGERRSEKSDSKNDIEKSLASTKSDMERADERQPAETGPSKTTTTKTTSDKSISIPTRTVRVPEEYRTKILLNDVRSMQNSIGLPQPPRFQRSSLDSPDEPTFQTSRVGPMVGSLPSYFAQPDALSNLSNGLEMMAPKYAQAVDQSRQLNSGRLDRSAKREELPLMSNNEAFEALRLSANKAKILRSEKLSELEKFQQRLRSQQKLLESIKSSAEIQIQHNPATASRAPSDTANSHVKYDEPNDNDDSSHNSLVADVRHSSKSSVSQERTSNTDAGTQIDNKLLHVHKLGASSQNEVHRNGAKNTTEGKKMELRSPNTINLDFINSVTALSVDHSNPFAISSVNPAVQRSSGRLSPHRLTAPASSNSTNSIIGSLGRLFGSSGSINSIDSEEKPNTGGSLGGALRIDATGSSSLVPNNHQLPAGDQAQVGPGHFLHEAANTSHKSSVQMPRGAELSLHNSDTNRDGFEIRDKPVHAGNDRFLEVVASH